MIIKNVSGSTRYFGLPSKAKARGRLIANNATSTTNDDPYTLAKVQGYVDTGLMQIVEGPPSTELLGGGTLPAYGNITFTGAAVNGETVTIAGKIFQYAATAGAVTAGNIWAGAGAAMPTGATTLITAINATNFNVTADPPLIPVGGTYIIPLRTRNDTISITGLAMSETLSNGTVTAFTAGASNAARRVVLVTHTVTAGEDTAGYVLIQTDLASITWNQVQVITAAGVARPYTGVITTAGGAMLLTEGTVVATDVYYIMAGE